MACNSVQLCDFQSNTFFAQLNPCISISGHKVASDFHEYTIHFISQLANWRPLSSQPLDTYCIRTFFQMETFLKELALPCVCLGALN